MTIPFRQRCRFQTADPLRDALESLLPLARQERDCLVSEIVFEPASIGQAVLNRRLITKAVAWNERIMAAEDALAKSRGDL